jgi:peroxiredoxin
MVLNPQKTFVAGLLVALLTSVAAAQNRVDFSLRSIDGQTVSSDSLRGEVVVLAFGASWLPLSKTQLQGVRKLADEYSNRNVVVYWVSTESDDSKSKNFASDQQLILFAKVRSERDCAARSEWRCVEEVWCGPTAVDRDSRQRRKHRRHADRWPRSARQSRRATSAQTGQAALITPDAFRTD